MGLHQLLLSCNWR